MCPHLSLWFDVLKNFLPCLNRVLKKYKKQMNIFSGSMHSTVGLFPIWVVLIYSGRYNKNTTDWGLQQPTSYFSQLWRLGSPRSRCWKIWCLLRTLFPFIRVPILMNLLILKAPTYVITLGVSISTYKFWRIQTFSLYQQIYIYYLSKLITLLYYFLKLIFKMIICNVIQLL